MYCQIDFFIQQILNKQGFLCKSYKWKIIQIKIQYSIDRQPNFVTHIRTDRRTDIGPQSKLTDRENSQIQNKSFKNHTSYYDCLIFFGINGSKIALIPSTRCN